MKWYMQGIFHTVYSSVQTKQDFKHVYYQKCEPTKYIYSLSAIDYNNYFNENN